MCGEREGEGGGKGEREGGREGRLGRERGGGGGWEGMYVKKCVWRGNRYQAFFCATALMIFVSFGGEDEGHGSHS